MPRPTPAEESLNVRVALAIIAVRDAYEAMRDVLDEQALTAQQRRVVERETGHLDGLGESLQLWRTTTGRTGPKPKKHHA